MTDEIILGMIAEAAQVFGESAREVSLHLGETMLAKPIAGVKAYFGASEDEIATARLAVARRCMADRDFAVRLSQCKVDVMKMIGG